MTNGENLISYDEPVNPTGGMIGDSFQSYIGAKIIKARPMTKDQFSLMKGLQVNENEEDCQGYLVEYPDNYLSWSPKYVFEEAYRLISNGEKLLI